MPRISVIIPAYNSAAYIAETVGSAQALEHDDKEVIVVDDGSRDATAEIVSAMPGVTLIRQTNAGDSAARQTGLAASSGEFIMFLDHDDILLPGAAGMHLAAIEQGDGFDMVFGANLRIDSAGRVIGENPQVPRAFSAEAVIFGVTPSFSQCMYRRSALERVGGLRPIALAAADHDLNLRVLGWEKRGFVHDGFVMKYRLHESQQTKSPARLYQMHLDTLTRLLGPGGELENAEMLARATEHWQRYYGQFLPAEVGRMVAQGKLDRALAAATLFLRISPRAVPSSIKHWSGRLSRGRKAA